MAIKRVKVKIDAEEVIKRVEKEINKEITIKVPIKGIKVDFGTNDDWSWVWGVLVVVTMVVMGLIMQQKDKTIRQLIEEKNRIEMTPMPTAVQLGGQTTPTMTLMPTPTVKLRYRR